MVDTLAHTSVIGARDRVSLLVGFAGALRRLELVSLDVADVVFAADGLVVNLRRSKTDQEGLGRQVGLPSGSDPLTCPVRSLRDWLAVAAIAERPLFRVVDRHANIAVSGLTDQSVALVMKRCARAGGLDRLLSLAERRWRTKRFDENGDVRVITDWVWSTDPTTMRSQLPPL